MNAGPILRNFSESNTFSSIESDVSALADSVAGGSGSCPCTAKTEVHDQTSRQTDKTRKQRWVLEFIAYIIVKNCQIQFWFGSGGGQSEIPKTSTKAVYLGTQTYRSTVPKSLSCADRHDYDSERQTSTRRRLRVLMDVVALIDGFPDHLRLDRGSHRSARVCVCLAN